MMGGMMPMAGVNAPMSGAATTSVADSAPEEESAPAKEFFDLKLVGFESASKIKVIKEVRALSGLGLKEAKELVEGVPKIVKKEVSKAEGEEMLEKLKAVGAEVAL